MDYNLEKLDFNPELFKKIMQSNILLFCVVLLLVLKIGTIIIFVNFPQNIFFADITKTSLESFANQTRQSLGLQPLIENQKLNQAAQLKAENMVQNNYFAHISPTGVTPWHWFSQVGYNYRYAGENLAIGFFDSEEVYEAWLNSPSHKENILNPKYKEVGTAVLGGFGPNNAFVVVQEFGSQLPVKTVPIKTAPIKTVEPTPATSQVETNEKVLSQTTQAQSILEPVKTGSSYESLLQNVIYGVSLVVVGMLLVMIFLNLNSDFKGQLVLRSVIVVILLSLATALSKELVISIIPHQIII